MDATCRGDTQLIVGLDDDDPTLDAYPTPGCGTMIGSGLHHDFPGWVNALAAVHVSEYRFVGMIGDDNVPRTEGWDTRVIESLAEHNFCWADDLDPGRAPGSMSMHIFMRSDVVRKIGYMAPASIRHMYNDVVWFAWATATSGEFLSDVVIEHLHYSLGKSPMDDTYQHSTASIPENCRQYNDYCDDGMNADIKKLGGRPFSPEAMMEFNRNLNIPYRWDA